MIEDVDVQQLDDGRWVAVTADNVMYEFPNEDEACAFQRGWRAALALDPITGES